MRIADLILKKRDGAPSCRLAPEEHENRWGEEE
jgi:hypothetical protein